VYQSNEAGNDDIFLFSLRNQLINTLQTLNTDADESQPDVSNDGDVLVYVSNRQGQDELRVFDMRNGNNFRVPVANRGLTQVNWPTISGNGDVIAYGATDGQRSDVYVYSLEMAAQLTPPFLNTESGEYNPDLNDMGDLITFVSDRRGSEDIYVVDMRSGFIDNMVLANSEAAEQEPRWLAGGDNSIVFHTNRTGEFRIMAYNLDNAVLNTLPVANELDPVQGEMMLRPDFTVPVVQMHMAEGAE
jgi:Tol biopolymer transport system component